MLAAPNYLQHLNNYFLMQCDVSKNQNQSSLSISISLLCQLCCWAYLDKEPTRQLFDSTDYFWVLPCRASRRVVARHSNNSTRPSHHQPAGRGQQLLHAACWDRIEVLIWTFWLSAGLLCVCQGGYIGQVLSFQILNTVIATYHGRFVECWGRNRWWKIRLPWSTIRLCCQTWKC